jgi:hypothetical protein
VGTEDRTNETPEGHIATQMFVRRGAVIGERADDSSAAARPGRAAAGLSSRVG